MISDKQYVRIVCTDRGAHPSRELAVLVNYHGMVTYTARRKAARPGTVDMASVAEGSQWKPDHVVLGTAVFRFRCPTCRLDVPRREPAVQQLVDGLLARDVHLFDLSQVRAKMI